jgi:lambda family phage portal protein
VTPTVTLVDQHGHPMPAPKPPVASQIAGAGTPRALNGNHNAPYDAADIYGQDMAAWRPYLWSPDTAINPWRDRVVSRARDIAQNDGWASGALTRITDNVVGATLRPISKPDYKALAEYTGNKAFDRIWAKEFAAAIDAHWRCWAYDPGKWCDAHRLQNFTQILRVAFRHKLLDGDALAVLKNLQKRVSHGRARYATAVDLIDPDRLSNPQLKFDSNSTRGGVELDPTDEYAPVGYWIRKAHQGDWWAAADSVMWVKVPKETSWGRPITVHDFDADRANQHRGVGVLTPVMQRLKMLIKYDGAEVQSAVINAIFSAYIESPFDHQLLTQALGDDGGLENQLSAYQTDRAAFHNERKMMLGDARIPTLYPGEKIGMVNATRPATNFAGFESAVLRNIASGMGLSAQQISNNWSDVNYSSARAALLEFWKTLHRRRHDFGTGFADPIRSAWLEECFEVEALPLPSGVVPDFIECRGAYGRCRWMGPGKGIIDSVAERQGSILALNGGLSTLEDECAEQGLEWEEVAEQRKEEADTFKQLGLPPPTWLGAAPLESSRKPGMDDAAKGADDQGGKRAA